MHEGPRGISALIRPRSIAIVGASARRSAAGNQLLGHLAATGYAGDVHVVHPDVEMLDGHATVPTVFDLPAGVDLACVSVPAAAVVESVAALAEQACSAALIPAVGLTHEEGRILRSIARDSGMVVAGPNTMGVINVTDRIHLNFWAGVLDDVRCGGIALVAQSGGACLSIVRSTERAGFSRIVASGNEWVCTSADYLSWLASDDATRAVGVVIESIADVATFTEAVTLLRTAGKPVVALHVGRTATGSAATVAHTSAILGHGAAYRAYFDSIDVPVVRDYDEMAAVLDCYHLEPMPRVTSRGIAVITVSGGVAALSGDTAEERGVDLPELSDRTCLTLAGTFPGATPQNPFDAGGGATYSGAALEEAIVALSADDGVGAVLAVLDGQASLSAGEVAYADEDFRAAAAAATRAVVPVVVASTGSMAIHPVWREGVCADIPVLRGIGSALVALESLGRNQLPVRPWPAPVSHPVQGGSVQPVDAATAADLVRECGIDTPASVVVDSAEQARTAARNLRFPLVVKALSPLVPHRTDVGGVELGITDEAGLAAAIGRVDDAVRALVPDVVELRFEIQEQVESQLEAFIGFAHDAVFGPVVTVGTGGVLVELVHDTAVGLTPLGVEEALALIEGTLLARRAAGFRGLVPGTDLRPLARAVAAVGAVAFRHREWLVAGDLNPVLLVEGSGRPVVVDTLFLERRFSTAEDPCLSASIDI